MAPKPCNKNCPVCGQFMRLIWVESGAPALPEGYASDGPQAVFWCESCNGPDSDGEVLTEEYEWLWLFDGVEFGWDEMDPGEVAEIRLEEVEMKRRFDNRQYRATPKDWHPIYPRRGEKKDPATMESDAESDLQGRSEEFFSGLRDPNRKLMDFSTLSAKG